MPHTKFCAPLIVAVLLALPRVAAARQLKSPLTIRGTVTRPDGTSLPGAIVVVEAPNAIPLVTVRANAAGVFYIEYSGSNTAPWISATLIGYRKERRPLAGVGSGTGGAVVNFTLRESTVTLRAARIVAQRPKAARESSSRNSTPGTNQTTLDRSTGLSGDVSGDLTAALGMVPGITLVTNPDGTVSASVGGLGTDQNSATLNGSDFTGGSLPRDGLLQTVRISTYDPKVGRFGGLQIGSTLPSGSVLSLRTLRITVDDPSLQSTTYVGEALGNPVQDLIASGTASGPLITDRMYVSGAFQLGRRHSELVTLDAAPRSALDALGVNRDSVDRLLLIAREIGFPLASGAPQHRQTLSGSAIGRLDFTPNAQVLGNSEGDVLYLLASTSWKDVGELGAAPTALATRLYQSRHRDAQLLLSYSPYFRSVLNETRASLSVSDDRTLPYVDLPASFVQLNSGPTPPASGSAQLELGGTGGTRSTLRNRIAQLSNETSWMTLDHSHRFNLYLDAEIQHFDLLQTSNRLGTYSYASLQDFADNRPAAFVRMPATIARNGSVAQGVLAFSDLFYVSKASRNDFVVDGNGLTIQYGARVDAQQFGARPDFNPSVDAAFGARTDRVPNSVAVQPMIGFTWKAGVYTIASGPARFTETRSRLDGGIRRYRSPLSPLSVDAVSRQTGLPGAVQRLECVGAAVPPPDWRAIAQSESALPDHCADGAGPSLVQGTQPVRFYAPDFTSPQSWRGELTWRWFFSGQLSGHIGGSVSSNVTQTSPFDVNFRALRRLTLADEGARAVFASSLSIDSRTGRVASTESRISPAFAQVTELRSDLSSRVQQLTGGLTYRYGTSAFVSGFDPTPRRFNATIRAWYSYSVNRTQSRGFAGTTGADPRVTFWSDGALPRHTVQAILQAHLDRWFDISLSARVNSGVPFTPIVGTDINGDGYTNDRAFVFDPSQTTDTDLRTSMNAVLTGAPSAIQSCLRAQLGRIAGAASCRGPWTAALGTLAISIDPFRLGLGNRGSVTLYINNALGGIDQLLHGENHLRGWGDPGFADPVLLNVQGFDPAANRFRYSVNPRFGTTSAFAASFRQPARLTLDVRLDASRNIESQAIEGFVRRGIGDGPLTTTRLKESLISAAGLASGGEIDRILQRSDSLNLTVAQQERLRELKAMLKSERDTLYGSLAEYLVVRQGEYQAPQVRERWHSDIARSIRRTFEVGREVRELLSPEQMSWLRNRRLTLSLEYSPDWLERTTRGYLLLPR